jgi:SMODS-associated and fused to various effectors sensor domain/TIR domain
VKQVFLSYRHTDAEAVSTLERALREAGLLPWRDVTSLLTGLQMEPEIRGALAAECGTAVLWLTRQALAPGSYVMRIELPAMLDAAEAKRLGFVPVFVDQAIEEAAKAVFDQTGRSISGYTGLAAQPGEDTAALARRVATAVAKAHLDRVWDRSIQTPPKVEVRTFGPPNRQSDCVLAFDWSQAYRDGAIPSPDEQAVLKAALSGSSEPLRAANAPIHLDMKARLSVGFAFGHEFRSTTGVVPRIDHYGEVWAADRSARGADPLVETIEYGPPDGDDVAVEVSITRKVKADVRAFAGLRGRPFRAHLRLEPPNGPAPDSLPDSLHANVWARQIRERMAQVRDQFGVGEIALFLNGPLVLAVLIGWWSIKTGPVTFYDWGDSGPYRPGWRIP